MDFSLETLVRENIKKMTAYSSARHEFTGKASVFLDANENSFGSPLPDNFNRYPDPLQIQVKEKLSQVKGVPPQNIFLGNGSDEAIDLLYRIFCEPGRDNAIILPPTYGMYEVCAEMNNVKVKKVNLTKDFQLNIDSIEETIDPFTKLLFICSPNNPSQCLRPNVREDRTDDHHRHEAWFDRLVGGGRIRRGARKRATVHHEAVTADHQRRDPRIFQAGESRNRAAGGR
jgi:hypothetical protein